ncbi:MAG: site-specific integrase [Bacteroidetes bacterium]|nr:site-specific integrase [Bacteroidota bacterium]
MKLSKRASNGMYYITYIQDGKQVRFSTKTSNQKIANEIFKKFQTGNYIPTVELKKESVTTKKNTVHYLVFQYLKYAEKHFTSETMVSVKSHMKTLLNKTPQNMDITDLTFQKLNEIVNNQCSPYQSLLCRNYLNMLFNWLIDNGYFTGVNPVAKIKKPKIVQKLPCYIGVPELELILNETKNLNFDIRSLTFDITLFAFYTGMRLNEITSLQWNQVNFDTGTIKLDNQTSKTKSGKVRVIPISSKILPMLLHRYENRSLDTMVFNHSFSTKNFNDLISKNFKKCIKRLPQLNQKIHFHTLRHSFASQLILHNVNLLVVSKLMGHSKLSTTLVYAHVQDNLLTDAINTL